MIKKIFNFPFAFLLLTTCLRLDCAVKFLGRSGTLALEQTNSKLTLSTSLPITSGTLRLRSTTGTTDGNVASATGAETITFSNSSLQLGTSNTDFTGGTYDPKTGSTRDAISLGNNQIMSVSAGTTLFNDVAVASGATATILGTPTFVSSVSLADSSSVLNLGIQSKLNKDIVLNGGKLVLMDNLELADGVRIWGTGTVDVNYKSLTFGSQVNSSVFSKDLTFWRAKDIQLNGPATLTGNWSFLTNSTDNESVINGNGNTLILNGALINVGDASGGHTLYISDLYIKGLSNVFGYTVPGITKAQYAAISGLAGATVTAGNSAYDAGFTVLSTNASSFINANGISVYDNPTTAAPFLFGTPTGSIAPRKTTLNSGPTTTTIPSITTYTDFLDVGTDGTYASFNNSNGGFFYFNGSTTTDIDTRAGTNTRQRVTVGSANHIYQVLSSNLTNIQKYNGTPNSWNTSWATGYTSIVDMSASNDGYLWVLDNTGVGAYTLTKTNGGTKASGTNIPLPENPTTFTCGLIGYRCAISIKGSTSGTLYGGYCGVSGTIYSSTDGITFTPIGNFGASGIAVGAKGTIAFTGPNDTATPGYSNGRAVFIKPPVNSGFNLYDGGATDANRGKVVLSNVTLELAGDYTNSAGHITFKGDNCKIITGGNKTFTVSGSNAPVEVDSVALTYDALGGTNSYPFSGTAVTLTNGGIVRSANFPGELVVDANLYNGSSAPTLTGNYPISASTGKITVTNTSGAASQTVTINGGNYFWDFPGGTVTGLAIADKVTVTLTNVILKNFSLSNVSFGGANAALVFGDGCVIELGADQSLTTGQGAWLFSGNATIRGMGQTITLNNADSIKQSVANKTLTISNAILKSLATGSLSCVSLGTVALTNSTLQVNTGGFSWAAGNLDINGYSKLSAMNITTSGGSATFTLSTSGNLTVNTGSTLELGRAINFAYSPTTTGDTGGITGTVAKRHLLVGLSGDASATLYANNCSIDATAVGLALDRGNFVVDNKVVLTASTTASYESELGSALNVEILSAGVLRLDGGVKYTVTTV